MYKFNISYHLEKFANMEVVSVGHQQKMEKAAVKIQAGVRGSLVRNGLNLKTAEQLTTGIHSNIYSAYKLSVYHLIFIYKHVSKDPFHTTIFYSLANLIQKQSGVPRGVADLWDHVNHIAWVVSDVGRSVNFFTHVVGMTQILRPNFDR